MNTKIFIIFLCLISCNNPQKDKEPIPIESEYEKEQRIKKEEDLTTRENDLKFSNKYNALIGWDTTRYYTYQLSHLFDSTKKIASSKMQINDIEIIENKYLLKAVTLIKEKQEDDYYVEGMYYLELTVSDLPQNKIDSLLKYRNWKRGFFVYKVTSVKSIIPYLTSSCESNGEFCTGDYFLSHSLHQRIIKGTLIDFYLYEKSDDDIL